jgi:hypothetical protein
MDDGSCGWITSPATKYRWADIPKVTGYPDYLYADGEVAGYPLRSTNNLSGTSGPNRVVFGRWSSLVIGLWPLSVLIDPYSQGTTANAKIYLDIFVDVGALVGPAFCVSADAGNQ